MCPVVVCLYSAHCSQQRSSRHGATDLCQQGLAQTHSYADSLGPGSVSGSPPLPRLQHQATELGWEACWGDVPPGMTCAGKPKGRGPHFPDERHWPALGLAEGVRVEGAFSRCCHCAPQDSTWAPLGSCSLGLGLALGT